MNVQKTDMLKDYFKLDQLGTNVRTEVLAGFTTFLTMSYIIFVNPLFLSFFGDPDLAAKALPFSASLTATCLAAAVMCIVMGLVTNYPFALAPGMGLNAIVAYQMVAGMGLSWPSAMGVIVMEGTIITVLVITGFREAVMNSIPLSLKRAISVGIGLFIAFIGLVQAGFVQKSDSTLVTLGRFDNLPVVVAIFGLLLTAILLKL
jgi:AGZA family xanthine/uracil permease-like MFS transporter